MAALQTNRLVDIHKLFAGRCGVLIRMVHSTGVCHQKEQISQNEEEFRVYQIEGLKPLNAFKRHRQSKIQMPPPRHHSMPTDQDWTDVWPTEATFKWSVVPFPVRQGFVKNTGENEGVVPSKYANLELMKVINFLHLTPLHVKKHCAALKKFCTPWPEGLETDADCRHHFPIESTTCDYLLAAPAVKDDRARVASIKFKLSDLELDYFSRDKFIRLAGDRYNKHTDIVTFESDRCPLKKQNLDFVNFLLTALYFESQKREGWESLKQLEDMERYFWDINAGRTKLVQLLRTIKETDEKGEASPGSDQRLSYLPSDLSDNETVCNLKEVQQHKSALETAINDKSNPDALKNYKASVLNLLSLKSDAVLL